MKVSAMLTVTGMGIGIGSAVLTAKGHEHGAEHIEGSHKYGY